MHSLTMASWFASDVLTACCAIQAQSRNLTVIDAGSALATLTTTPIKIEPQLNETARAAAVDVFGFATQTPEQAQSLAGRCFVALKV